MSITDAFKPRRGQRQRRGVALLTALLLSAGATTAAAITAGSGASASASVPRTGAWAPCPSSLPGPRYVVLVKGVYGTCVHYMAQVT